jgi:hypothetical protein
MAKLATIIRELDVKEFRKRFDITNDFTPEEENIQFDEAEAYEESKRMKLAEEED